MYDTIHDLYFLFGNGTLAASMSESYGLAGPFAEIIEFSASRFSTSDRSDIHDIWRMKREDSFDALVAHDSSDGKGFVNSAASACDYGPGEYLNTFLVAFFNAAAYIYSITYFETWYVFFKASAFNSIKQLCFHAFFSLV